MLLPKIAYLKLLLKLSSRHHLPFKSFFHCVNNNCIEESSRRITEYKATIIKLLQIQRKDETLVDHYLSLGQKAAKRQIRKVILSSRDTRN